jgi:UTP:GlnB (protein PII) uridylyltransferase
MLVGTVRRHRAALEDVAAFAASMPPSYREAFDPAEIATHAAIVARRGAGVTHVEPWDELPGRVLCVCVVAPDRAGLLARVSAALVAHEIDVVRAYGYTREGRDGVAEAICFFWLRRLRAGELETVSPEDVVAVAETIDALLRDDATLEPAPPPPPQTGATHVSFERGASGGMVLTVEATDRPDLLLAVTQTLYRAGLQIVGVRATSERGRAVDRFEIVEHDGTAVGAERVLTLHIAVLSAIEGASAGRAPEGSSDGDVSA